jgi:hypothetical protein
MGRIPVTRSTSCCRNLLSSVKWGGTSGKFVSYDSRWRFKILFEKRPLMSCWYLAAAEGKRADESQLMSGIKLGMHSIAARDVASASDGSQAKSCFKSEFTLVLSQARARCVNCRRVYEHIYIYILQRT